jgi:myo-inositol-1(or 4)-monophosphatase
VTDWLAACRGMVEDVSMVLGRMPTREAREVVVGAGRGGDQTLAVDAAAEQAVVERLELLHADGAEFTLVSEELGRRSFGESSTHVVLDPIDGSLNAKRGVPHFCLSIAVADGPTMGDVHFGFVHDFGSGEEWTAIRGEAPRLNGVPLDGELPHEEIELLGFEATRTNTIAEHAPAVVGLARRLRVMGSLALALCNLAAGRLDAVCSLKPARSVDIAAAQLLVLERGLAIELFETPPFAEAPLDVEGRSRVVAAATPEICSRLAEALAR